jgi:hypothetical protein
VEGGSDAKAKDLPYAKAKADHECRHAQLNRAVIRYFSPALL